MKRTTKIILNVLITLPVKLLLMLPWAFVGISLALMGYQKEEEKWMDIFFEICF